MTHEHKYFAFNTKKDFEPVVMDDGSIMYNMVEYLIAACSCGDAVKNVIRYDTESKTEQ